MFSQGLPNPPICFSGAATKSSFFASGEDVMKSFEARLDRLLQLQSELAYLYNRKLSARRNIMIEAKREARDELRAALVQDWQAVDKLAGPRLELQPYCYSCATRIPVGDQSPEPGTCNACYERSLREM